MSAPAKITLAGLPRAELEALAERLLAENADLRRTVAELRAEVATLEGVKRRPEVEPSGMEKGASSDPGATNRGRGAKASKAGRLPIEDRVVAAADVPAGSRFKGYEDFLVQDLVLRPHVVRLRRERWLTPDGGTVTAPMPAGITGHFGPELRRFVLAQYHQGQVTVPRLVAQLRAIGILISKRQVVRLLNAGQDAFLAEAREVLRAGLSTAGSISVDDTGARHRHRNGVCTQLGNDHFAAFATTGSKSRLNFLEVLRAGFADYVVNAEALAYMRRRALAGAVIDRLAADAERHFPDEAAWRRHLERLGIIGLTVTPDPARIPTQGAGWGRLRAARHHRADAHARPGADRDRGRGVGQHQGARAAARHGDPVRRRRPVRPRPARPVLGPRRAARAQARHLHRAPARGPAARAGLDLVAVRRPEGVQARAGAAATTRAAGALRPHLPPPHRVRHPRPAAGPAARQQGGAAAGAGAAGGAAAHERLRTGPAAPGGQAEDLRRHALGGRARLPGRLPRPAADLRQAGRVVLGLPRPPPRRARRGRPLPARPGQDALRDR